ncbi:unnamed protein product, partial [Amoebophrya sp. A25]
QHGTAPGDGGSADRNTAGADDAAKEKERKSKYKLNVHTSKVVHSTSGDETILQVAQEAQDDQEAATLDEDQRETTPLQDDGTETDATVQPLSPKRSALVVITEKPEGEPPQIYINDDNKSSNTSAKKGKPRPVSNTSSPQRMSTAG